MPELRLDPLSGLRVIVAGERSERPGAFLPVEDRPPIDPETDPFLEGHEDRTPPESWALRPDGSGPDRPGWRVRAVPNLYPALIGKQDSAEPDPLAASRGEPDLFASRPATGAHEVIVNNPRPVSSLLDLSTAEIEEAMEGWRERMRAHDDAACLHLIINEGQDAGASLPHTHAQLYALPFHAQHIARRPAARFEEHGPVGAALLRETLARLAATLGAVPPLNMWVRTAPRGAERFCWRIDVLPRLAHLAGLEVGAGIHLNVMPPERAAEQLRNVSL